MPCEFFLMQTYGVQILPMGGKLGLTRKVVVSQISIKKIV